jgi:hypothetical protein
MKRALHVVTVGVERVITKEWGREVINIEPEKRACEVWAVNGNVSELEAKLKLVAFDIETGAAVPLSHREVERTLTLAPNQSTDICRVHIPQAETTVLVAYLEDLETGSSLARWIIMA